MKDKAKDIQKEVVLKYKLPDIEQLNEAGCALGHDIKNTHRHFYEYLHPTSGKVDNMAIINLDLTYTLLSKACQILFNSAKNGQGILFIGLNENNSNLVKETAETAGCAYLINRYPPGLLTNFSTVKKSLSNLNVQKDTHNFTKEERIKWEKKLKKIEMAYGGLKNLDQLPKIIVTQNPTQNLLKEVAKLQNKVHLIVLVDSNEDPTVTTNPIPVNTSSTKSLTIIYKSFLDVIVAGKQETVLKNVKFDKNIMIKRNIHYKPFIKETNL